MTEYGPFNDATKDGTELLVSTDGLWYPNKRIVLRSGLSSIIFELDPKDRTRLIAALFDLSPDLEGWVEDLAGRLYAALTWEGSHDPASAPEPESAVGTPKITLHCPECGSTDITRPAEVRWDSSAEKFCVVNWTDTATCHTCGANGFFGDVETACWRPPQF